MEENVDRAFHRTQVGFSFTKEDRTRTNTNKRWEGEPFLNGYNIEFVSNNNKTSSLGDTQLLFFGIDYLLRWTLQLLFCLWHNEHSRDDFRFLVAFFWACASYGAEAMWNLWNLKKLDEQWVSNTTAVLHLFFFFSMKSKIPWSFKDGHFGLRFFNFHLTSKHVFYMSNDRFWVCRKKTLPICYCSHFFCQILQITVAHL